MASDEEGSSRIRVSEGRLDDRARATSVGVTEVAVARRVVLEEGIEPPAVDRRALARCHVVCVVEGDMGVRAARVGDRHRNVDRDRVDAEARIVPHVAGVVRSVRRPPADSGVPPVEVPAVGRILVDRDGDGDDRPLLVVGQRRESLLAFAADLHTRPVRPGRCQPEPLPVRVEDRPQIAEGINVALGVGAQVGACDDRLEEGGRNHGVAARRVRRPRLGVEGDTVDKPDEHVRARDCDLRVRRGAADRGGKAGIVGELRRRRARALGEPRPRRCSSCGALPLPLRSLLPHGTTPTQLSGTPGTGRAGGLLSSARS